MEKLQGDQLGWRDYALTIFFYRVTLFAFSSDCSTASLVGWITQMLLRNFREDTIIKHVFSDDAYFVLYKISKEMRFCI